jgi:HK97 family phage major capsid protein
MKNLNQLREERAQLVAKAEAITILAQEENRELNADEISTLDDILGKGDKPGLIAKKDEDIARVERIDAIMAREATRRAEKNRLFENEEVAEPSARKITVPASARRKPKHFESMEDAYAAGQFVAATILGNGKSRQWCQDHGILAAHSTFDNEKGGYVVPDAMENSIIRLVEERGVFRQNAMIYPMSTASVMIPRRTGGFTYYWGGEGQAMTSSDMTLNQAQLLAKKLYVYTTLSSEIGEDAIPALGELITQEIAYSMATAEDEAGFNGDGTSAFGGIVGLKSALAAGTVQDAAAGNNSALTLDLADFEAAVGKLPQFPGISPAWYVNSAVYWASMGRLMDAAGGNAVADLGNGPQLQFLGYPVRFTQCLPSTTGTLASTILMYFGDLRMAATMGTRRGVTVRTDESVLFASDQIAIRATQRLDINVHERGTVSAAGPIVALKTAS